MKLSAAYGLVAIGALALLTSGQWARTNIKPAGELLQFVMGVLPNFAAAIAIPFVILGIQAEQKPPMTGRTWKNWLLIAMIISGTGLIGWEFIQLTGRRFVFDPADIAATLAGLIVTALLFELVNRDGLTQ